MSETDKINNVITVVEDNSIIEKKIDNVDITYNDIVKQKKDDDDDDDETFEYKNRYSFAECIIC